jgi:hypothetical protein
MGGPGSSFKPSWIRHAVKADNWETCVAIMDIYPRCWLRASFFLTVARTELHEFGLFEFSEEPRLGVAE